MWGIFCDNNDILIQLLIGLLLTSAFAQSGSESKRPEGWKIRLDRPGFFSSEPYFVTMAPGWHITTGPSMIAYEATAAARGNYKLESEIMLFPGENCLQLCWWMPSSD